ncbi:MAG: hypothetical protein WCK89_24825 [bacterium]
MVLLAFVAASLAWMGIKQFRRPAASTASAESGPVAAMFMLALIQWSGPVPCSRLP